MCVKDKEQYMMMNLRCLELDISDYNSMPANDSKNV